jgi:Lrp/AsnC family transcriptional regulator
MLDKTNRRILALLQQDASLPIAQIAEAAGLSPTPCWRRIQKMEADGVITGRVALVAPEAVGLGLTVFVSIETGDHSADWLERFGPEIAAMPEVMELHRMAGDVDYLLRVVVADMAAFDRFYKRLIARAPLKNVSSRFSMERIKSTTQLPIPVE